MSEVPTSSTGPVLPYATPTAGPSKVWLWVGRVISIVPGLAILAGGVTDLLKADVAVKGLAEAGFPESVLVPLGLVTVLISLLYLIPQTMVLGALFILAYLGGAVVIHLHAGQYGQMFVPVIFGVVMWVGLLLREPRLRTLLPLRQL